MITKATVTKISGRGFLVCLFVLCILYALQIDTLSAFLKYGIVVLIALTPSLLIIWMGLKINYTGNHLG